MLQLEPSIDEIENMSYVDLLAYMGESNLPPGGFAGISNLVDFCHIHERSRVLHVGSSAGFLSRELARITGCSVVGVDISEKMVESAKKNAADEGLANQCSYICKDICLYESNNPYDVVLTGGSMAFIRDHEKALDSMVSNVKPYGFVGLCELSYHKSPPEELRDRIASIICNDVPEYSLNYWSDLASSHKGLHLWKTDMRPAGSASESNLDSYCTRMSEWAARGWSSAAKEALASRIRDYMKPFNENMAYLTAITLVYRFIPEENEPLLYI